LLTSIPLFSFKFSTLFNKINITLFFQTFSPYLTKSITSVPWWSPALTGVLYSPSNQQGQMLAYKSTLIKTKLYYIVHQLSCTLLYVLSLPLVHPAHRQLPTTSKHFTRAAATGTSCMRSPSWFHCTSVTLPTATQTVPSVEATSASSFLDSSEINPDLLAARRIASAAPKKTLLNRWNQNPKPLSLPDALSSVGISVPVVWYNGLRMHTSSKYPHCFPRPCICMPTTQTVKELLDESDLFPDVHMMVKHFLWFQNTWKVAEIEAQIKSHPRTERWVSSRKRKESKAKPTQQKEPKHKPCCNIILRWSL
jgi:hypothetical protein